MFVWYPRRIKALKLTILIIHIIVSYDQNILLICYVKDGSHFRFGIRLVFTLPPRDSTLHYKWYVHLWNNFPCIITLILIKFPSEQISNLHSMCSGSHGLVKVKCKEIWKIRKHNNRKSFSMAICKWDVTWLKN